MTKLSDIVKVLEEIAPLGLQESYDNSGLQVGEPDGEIGGVLVCLDVTEEVVEEARRRSCDLIVSHHPLLFHGLKSVTGATLQQRCVAQAIRNDISIYSAHTSLDNAVGGVNWAIAGRLGLGDLSALKPLEGGACGVKGSFETPIGPVELLTLIAERFGVQCVRHSGVPSHPIRTVAICGGAGAFLLEEAREQGIDCFITGEMHYHDWFDCGDVFTLELGHYESEICAVDLLADVISKAFHGLRVEKAETCTNPIGYFTKIIF